MKEIFFGFLKNKEVKNAGWLIGGKVLQMIISFFVGLWTARYLGPSNYGVINYVASYVAFFTAFCTLGITSSVLIGELTNKPDEEGATIGTSIVMRLISSVLSMVMIVAIVSIVDRDEPQTILIAVICSAGLVFQIFDIIEFWFQKRYMSKITAMATFLGYCATTFYKIYLLIFQKSLVYFALSSTVDYIVIAIVLLITYRKHSGPKLIFSIQRGKEILSVSYHFILSGMMVAIYGQTDKVMLKHMLSDTDVGYYSTASSLSTIWVFVLSAIITSMAPTIMQLKKDGDEAGYLRKNRQMYSIVFYISIFVSVCFTALAPIIIRVLYGEAYLGSINPLRTITWYVAFSYLGVARDTWMVCEGKQKYSKYMYVIACVANVCLNFIFIPVWGATGAALASLLTQVMTCIVIPMFFKEMRPNVKLMFDGIFYRRPINNNNRKQD